MKDIDADTLILILYKVSIPLTPELAQHVAGLGLDGAAPRLPLGECLVFEDTSQISNPSFLYLQKHYPKSGN
jgi:hypothetical protein